jgi:hypothetical protein
MKFTEEQLKIVKLSTTNNIIVDAVAGSGKTTTILGICLKNNLRRILVLTYNARLKLETRCKLKKMGLSSTTEAHSFNSFGYKYYSELCRTDEGICDAVIDKTKPTQEFNFNIVIVDESQDVNSIYYNFVLKILQDNTQKVNSIILLGDRMQNIYHSLKKSDSRYLTLGQKLYSKYVITQKWSYLSLSYSFRVPQTVCNLINHMTGFERIKSLKPNFKSNFKSKFRPYLIYESFPGTPFRISKLIDDLIYRRGYKPGDIFILGPSVERSKIMKNIANKIIKGKKGKRHKIYVSDEKGSINEKVIRNKICVTTFHSVKGLERKVVIIINFDNSYFTLPFGKDYDPSKIPNTIYVAMTRTSKLLYLINSKQYPRFIFLKDPKRYCYIDGTHQPSKRQMNLLKLGGEKREEIPWSVTSYIRFMDTTLEYISLNMIKRSTTIIINNEITVPKILESGDDTYENVSRITGIFAPIYHETIKQKKLSKYIIKEIKDSGLNTFDLSISNILEISGYLCSKTSGYDYIYKQMPKPDWISQSNAKDIIVNIDALKIKNQELECRLKSKYVVGHVDCICTLDDNMLHIIEYKFVTELESQHLIQLCFYAYLAHVNKINIKSYMLYNIRTGKCITITSKIDTIVSMCEKIIDYKRNSHCVKYSDKDFLSKAIHELPKITKTSQVQQDSDNEDVFFDDPIYD